MKKSLTLGVLISVLSAFFFCSICTACVKCSDPVQVCLNWVIGGGDCGWSIEPCGVGIFDCSHWEFKCDAKVSTACTAPSQDRLCVGTVTHYCNVTTGSNTICVDKGTTCKVMCAGEYEWKPCCVTESYPNWSCNGTWGTCY
jgi:hypothetical protein